ncbi:hypothetical protein H2248_002445 [Termitomyces sp. 'cryptogamus']|nr:hypothetical protein H2248_002445 [Termitomyces sp. 'cryptogamus']
MQARTSNDTLGVYSVISKIYSSFKTNLFFQFPPNHNRNPTQNQNLVYSLPAQHTSFQLLALTAQMPQHQPISQTNLRQLLQQNQYQASSFVSSSLNKSSLLPPPHLLLPPPHVLRSTHIPAYNQLVRAPYTSDPFPLLVTQVQTVNSSPYAPIPPSNQNQYQHASPLSTIQRETVILDKFIALKVREDVWADDSELHLERDEAYKDLFDHVQPCARLEDQVRV